MTRSARCCCGVLAALYTVGMVKSGDDPIDLGSEPISGLVQLVFDAEHFQRVVLEGMLQAEVSLAIATADFKAMLIPTGARTAPSIVQRLAVLAERGVEVRLMHASVPSSAALGELKRRLPENLVIRRCPRLHAKAVVVDAKSMYIGSANLTGAGLGAKGAERRNFEWGVSTESPALIDAVLQQFNALWTGDRCETCKRHDICPEPLEEPKL